MASNNLRMGIEIAANVTGQESVETLTNRLDDASVLLGGELKDRARQAAAELRRLAEQEAAIQAFAKLKSETASAARSLRDIEREATNYGKQITAIGPPTEREATALKNLRDAAGAASSKLGQQQHALAAAGTDLQRYGIASQNTQAAQARLAQQTKAVRDSVQDLVPAYQSAASGAAVSAGKQVQATKQIESGLDSLKGQLNSLRNIAVAALGGSFVGSLAKDVADTADEFNNLQSRIQLVTGEGPAFEASFEAVSAMALRTNSALESTGTLFTKVAEAGKSAGLGTQAAIDQALKLTETVNQAVQLSGASAQASDAAVTQLIQGLQGGVLRGDEFNSVMEQSPRLAKALADGLGVTTGELRKMAEAGQLSSETVIKALQGQADAVASEFSKLPPTVGRAIQNLSTSWTLYVGETDKATGASSAAASAINALSSNLSTVAGFLIDAGQAAAALAAIRLAQYFLGIGAAATTATTAVVANTAAVTAAGVAGSTAAVGVGRFAAILGSLKLFSLLGIITNFKDIGTAIGEGAAKLMGYKIRIEELASAEKTAALAAAESAASRKRMADATQEAINKQFELSKSAKTAIAEFDNLTKAGSTVNEAIVKIGKDFDLSTVPGIRDAAAVLDKLAADGKLSAGQFQAAWGEALKGADLAVFEVQARAAFAGTAREAERLGQVLDATLRESIKRTGLDFDVISGGMGKASRSAINDTEAMINGLDRLKAMGVDTAQALTASIGKSINTADSQKAIEAVKTQIEAVRKALGDKVADGLLDQAKQKADALKDALEKATPGVDSLREAMKNLGVVSDKSLQDVAKVAKESYDAMRSSGTASLRELQDGFKAYAEKAIAANNGVATEAIKAQAAMHKLEIQTDSAGKSIVKSMGEGKSATEQLAASIDAATSAAERQTAALEKQNQARERAIESREKEIQLTERENALERERLNIDKEGFSLDKSGGRLTVTTPTERSVYENAKAQGLTEAQALQISNQFIQNGRQTGFGDANQAIGENWGTQLQKAIDSLVLANAAKNAETGKPGSPTTTVNVRVTLPNNTVHTVPTTQDGQAALQQIIASLTSAKLSAGT